MATMEDEATVCNNLPTLREKSYKSEQSLVFLKPLCLLYAVFLGIFSNWADRVWLKSGDSTYLAPSLYQAVLCVTLILMESTEVDTVISILIIYLFTFF